MHKNYYLIALAISLLSTISCKGPKSSDKSEIKTTGYLFSYFNNNGKDGLHLAYSMDGLKWEALNNDKSLLAPVVGKDSLMRDPSVAQGKDGTFHMVWTTSWWDKGIGYASSKDLIHWSEQKFLPVMSHLNSTKNTWAPEVFYDKKDDLFYIVWASTVPELFEEIKTSESEKGLNHRLFYTTTKDFETFTPTEVFFEPGFSVIDGAIIKTDSTYMMVIKNEMSAPAEKNLRTTFTNDLKSGFPTEISESISGKTWAEGPTPLQVGKYIYIYFDKYRDKKYGAIRSLDGVNWEDISDSISVPKGIRHGTAFPVSNDIIENLQKLK